MPPGPGLVHAQCPRRADGIASRTPHEVAYEPPTKTRPLTSAGGGGGSGEGLGAELSGGGAAPQRLRKAAAELRSTPIRHPRRFPQRGLATFALLADRSAKNEDNSFLEPMLSLILDARLSAQNNAFGSSHSHRGPSEPRGLCGRSGRTTKIPTPKICFSPRNTHGTVSA